MENQPPADELTDDPFRILRRVHRQGTVAFGGAIYNLGRRSSRCVVTIVADGNDVRVYLGEQLIRIHARGAPGSYVRSDSMKKREVIIRTLHTQELVSQAVSNLRRN